MDLLQALLRPTHIRVRSFSLPEFQQISQVGCCKAYDTKVGTHHFITRIDMDDHPLGKKLAKLEFGTSTGRQRMVGWFDAVEKNALRFGGFDWLVINKLDALSRTREDFDHLKICVAYEDIDGNRTTTTPRTESKSLNLKPVYEIFQSGKKILANALISQICH